jgi:hypothetical protein
VFILIMRPVSNLGAISDQRGWMAVVDPSITIQHNTINNIIGARGITMTADTFAGPATPDRRQRHRPPWIDLKHGISVNFVNNATGNVTVSNNRISQAAPLWTAGPGTRNGVLL